MLNLELGSLLLVIIISYRKTKRKKYSQKVFNTLVSLKDHKNFNFIQVSENKEYRKKIQQSNKKIIIFG